MVFQHFSLFESADSRREHRARPRPTTSRSAPSRQRTAHLPRLRPAARSLALVGDLSVGERQRIEIVRCLLQKPQLIILDEPTSVLTPQEADKLFETLERLRSEGNSILYISAPPRRGEADLRHGATMLRARQGGRPMRPAPGDGRLARPHDGRQPRSAGAPAGRGLEEARRCSRSRPVATRRRRSRSR